MTNGTVDRIQERDLESVWEDGEQDFSGWMAENIGLLGSELNVELTDAQAAAADGDDPADVVANNTNTDETVVVENQFDTTSPDHLGELLTAASEHDAGLLVWVAEAFTHEHQAVLEWLNENGPEGLDCFAIRPRVVSIPASDTHGVEFEILAEPADWRWEMTDNPGSETDARDGAQADDENAVEPEYTEFFDRMAEAYTERRPGLEEPTPNNERSLAFSTDIPGVDFEWAVYDDSEFSVELYIATADEQRNEMIFKSLREAGDEIESSLGVGLEWQPLPEDDACRINWPKHVEDSLADQNEQQQSQLIEWGVDAMDEFQTELEPRLLSLEIDA